MSAFRTRIDMSAERGGSAAQNRIQRSPLPPEIARQIVDLFQKTGSPTPQASTMQEKHLVALLAEGDSYQSAAEQMHVSVNIVRNYVRGVYEKLHVHSKSEAVSKAFRRGLL